MSRLGIAISLLLVILVGGTLFATLDHGSGSGGRTFVREHESLLGWSIRYPREMHVEHSAAASRNGHFAVDETTFGSFRTQHGVQHRTSSGTESIHELPPRTKSGRFPANGIALRVEESWTPLPGHRPPRGTTRLPLRLSQFHKGGQWASPKPGAVWHSLRAYGQSYLIFAWIGRRAPAQQRALLDRMVASISVRRVPGQS